MEGRDGWRVPPRIFNPTALCCVSCKILCDDVGIRVRQYSLVHTLKTCTRTRRAIGGQPFFYMAFACCVNVYMVSVHTRST